MVNHLLIRKCLLTLQCKQNKKAKHMLKSEFEGLTGRTVSDEYYGIVEIAYLASGLDKEEFCKTWESASGPVTFLLEELAGMIKSLEGELCRYKDGSVKAGKKLLAVANTIERDGRNVVATDDTIIDIAALLKDTSRLLLIDKAYTRECLEKGYSLSDSDRQYLLNLMDHE